MNTKWIAWRIHFQMRLYTYTDTLSHIHTYAPNFVIIRSEDYDHITNDRVEKKGKNRTKETVRLALVNLCAFSYTVCSAIK